ncbi:LytR/AlgR family response regulator transcription factor [Priestia endophytica]|uniref:LytR/AlgR family response regulator transcription factor n=1 Tax=Priestia endophytica TaxID=135735 RepID=UPI00124C011E|nr:LytTR family DNA-binding domain-containing protein [Priestia endophytica]KAB2488215.1 response regulator transcription factor [Priestia endophytica]
MKVNISIGKLNLLIVDNDKDTISQVNDLVDDITYIDCIGAFRSPKQIINCLNNHKVDIVLLNTNMLSVHKLNLAKYIYHNHRYIDIVFISQDGTYALESYEYYPIDYLIKPINFLRLEQTLKKVYNKKFGAELHKEKKIGIKANGCLNLVSLAEISYIERINRKTVVTLENGEEIESNDGLGDMEERLKRYGFYRPHQSYLIPLNKISEVSPDIYMNSYNLKLKNCRDTIKVSRHKYRELKDIISRVF